MRAEKLKTFLVDVVQVFCGHSSIVAINLRSPDSNGLDKQCSLCSSKMIWKKWAPNPHQIGKPFGAHLQEILFQEHRQLLGRNYNGRNLPNFLINK